MKKLSRFNESANDPKSQDYDNLKNLEDYFYNNTDPLNDKLANFSKFVTRQDITYFLAKYEIFKKIIHVNGSIVECGVLFGGGLMEFAKLSSIFEPVNYSRKIIGFDTFQGFPNLSKKDVGSTSTLAKKNGLKLDSYADIQKCIELYDSNRFLGNIPKIELVKGNAVKTIPKYLKQNPHTIISLLYLDMDIYEPTKVALENFLPRMPKGSIIVFDEINSKKWIGETLAVLDTIGIQNLRLERFDFHPLLSYAVLD